MTDEQKYNELIKEIGSLLADKNATISCQRYQIDQLEQRLKMAEAERDKAQFALEHAESHVGALIAEIETLKGGAA